MSELFRSLKRADEEKQRALREAAREEVRQGLVAEAVAVERASEAKKAELLPAHAYIGTTIQFELGAADYKVRNVLDPVTQAGEQFRLLRAELTAIRKQRHIRTLLITSAGPGEGKTFASCGLAGVLAQEPGRRVLLIDADLRKPRAGKGIGILADPDKLRGLSDILRGEASLSEVIVSAMEGALFCVPAGKLPVNPSELLSSPNLERVIREARELFDWIVVDAPPVLPLSDASILAPVCDGVLLVVHSGVTSAKLVKDAVQRLGRERIFGILMNRAKYLRTTRYYQQYYDSARQA